ncbi:MAG: (Fe-S)-binding protein [Candidatus Bathyarchaeia archaeon]
MPQYKYSSLNEFYDEVVREFLDKCIFCGRCLENCPMTTLVLRGVTPKKVIKEVARFLKEGEHSKEVYLKAFGCTLCGECSNSCPLGIDVVEVFSKVRSEYFKRGIIPDAFKHKDFATLKDPTILSSMLVKPSERRWMAASSFEPHQTENLVFLGCTLLFHPHFTFPLLDILEAMQMDFIAIGGGPIKKDVNLCCGFPQYFSGNIGMLNKTVEELVFTFKQFAPKRVVLACTACYHFINKIYKKLKFFDIDFEVKYYAQFLLDHINKLEFKKPLKKTVYFQPSCRNRSAKVDNVLHKLLEKIPGVEVIKGQPLCCGGTPKVALPEVYLQTAQVFREVLSKKVAESRSDILTLGCQQCTLAFSPYLTHGLPFAVKSIFEIINEAIGGKEYENRWLKYWKCRNEDEIIEVSRDYFEANGITEGEARKTLPFILSWK